LAINLALRITGVFDFGLRPVFKNVENTENVHPGLLGYWSLSILRSRKNVSENTQQKLWQSIHRSGTAIYMAIKTYATNLSNRHSLRKPMHSNEWKVGFTISSFIIMHCYMFSCYRPST
jgi:hypothetical protein